MNTLNIFFTMHMLGMLLVVLLTVSKATHQFYHSLAGLAYKSLLCGQRVLF